MAGKSNRRDFMKQTGLASAGFWVATRDAWAQAKSANEKVNFAAIGCGGKGSSDVDGTVHAGGNCVALCDVDLEKDDAKATFEKYPKAKRYTDFRKMLEENEKDIDAVTISTPDHTHAVATMMAMKMGKAVYTQKPLTHDVYEARMLTEYATDNKIVSQMGNQGTAESGLREAVEVVWSGALGAIREVHVWTNRPVWPQGTGAILQLKGVQAALHGGSYNPTPRKGLDWDLWLGTAPERAYDDIYSPFRWRGWWDYGTGALGDMACHTANMAFMACKLGYPTSVEAEMSEYNPETFPMWSIVRYKFPEREGMPPLSWTWYDGGQNKPAWIMPKLRELAHGMPVNPGAGSLIIGDEGTLYSPNDYGSEYHLLPKEKFADFKPPTPTLPRSPGHHREWVKAVEEGKPELCVSNFGYAGPLTETVVLGCVALRAQKKILWDGPNMKITNVPEANAYLKRDYRGSWSL